MVHELPQYLRQDPLDAAVRDALLSGRVDDFHSASEEPGPGIFAFPLLTRSACTDLLAEVDRRTVELTSSESAGPNSMHDYGETLATLGMDDLSRVLRNMFTPIATRLFADCGGSEIDGEHAFLAEYGAEFDDALGFHVDDSAVTLNVCLGENFSGAEIYFRGMRCDLHRQTSATPTESFELEHEVGTALLHAGRHRHGVHPIRRGRRRNLILWMQSSSAKRRAQACQSWCGARADSTEPR